MARSFTGGTQFIETGIGSFSGVAFEYGSIAVICRRGVTAAWETILNSHLFSSNNDSIDLEFEPSNRLGFGIDSLSTSQFAYCSAITFTDTSKWYFILVSKATGTVKPRAHVLDLSTQTWTHVDFDTTLVDGTYTGASRWQIGKWGLNSADMYQGDIAAVGAFRQWVPTDDEVESSGMAYSVEPWFLAVKKSANGVFWVLDQSATSMKVYDWTGSGADEVATSATPPGISSNSVPYLSYNATVSPVGLSSGVAAQTIGSATVTVDSSVVAGAISPSPVTVGSATVSTASSVVVGTITGAGSVTIGSATVSVASSVVAGALTPAPVTIGAATLAVVASVAPGALSPGPVTIGSTSVVVAASIVAGAITSGSAANIGSATVTVASSVIGGAISATGAAPIGSATLTVATSVVAGGLTASGSVTIGSATVAIASSIVAGGVSVGPVTIDSAVLVVSVNVIAGAITGSGAVAIGPTTVGIASSIIAGAIAAGDLPVESLVILVTVSLVKLVTVQASLNRQTSVTSELQKIAYVESEVWG